MYVLSVPSSIPCRPVMTFANKSSCERLATSFSEIPSFWNASLPFFACVASVFMEGFNASMLVPECCMIASHSWYACAEMPIFCDILSILSPYDATSPAPFTIAPPAASAAVPTAATAAAPTVAAFLSPLPKVEPLVSASPRPFSYSLESSDNFATRLSKSIVNLLMHLLHF